jgi:hypothetical protein
VLPFKKVDHGQGGGGTQARSLGGRKFFVIKILTSNPLAMNILQGMFV